MIVCDICGKHKVTKAYTVPMRTLWHIEYKGLPIKPYLKYESKSIDLCETCAQTIADAIGQLQDAFQKEG